MENPVPRLLILGARSDIAVPPARLYAQDGYDIVLAAQSSDRLDATAADLRVRSGRRVDICEFDVLDTEGHPSFVERLGTLPDCVITLVGLMTPNDAAQSNFRAADLMISVQLPRIGIHSRRNRQSNGTTRFRHNYRRFLGSGRLRSGQQLHLWVCKSGFHHISIGLT